MKLLRYGEWGQERPGVLDASGHVRDLAHMVKDIDAAFLADSGAQACVRHALERGELPEVPGTQRLGACVGGVSKIIGVGLNYIDHAAEVGLPLPPEPVLFMKATSALCGPNDPLIMPPGAEKLDWEVELGVVIGRTARYVREEDALDHVAGYCVVNDVSERSFQMDHAGQWVKGKSADSFCPIGPWLVTRDEIAQPQHLDLWLDVDGARKQQGNTATMLFGVVALVSYISHFMTLQPGDLICTGTPPGVGMGRKPPEFLRIGQDIRLGVAGLGAQNHRVTASCDQRCSPLLAPQARP